MSHNDDRLLRHLAAAVVVKLVALAVLWAVFVLHNPVPSSVEQSAAQVSSHIAAVMPSHGATP